MNKFLSIILAVVSVQAIAGGYVTAGDNSVVKTGNDLCLHTGYYSSAEAVKGCDTIADVSVVATEKPVPVILESDVLFKFDSAVLTAKGKKKLNIVAATVSGTVVIVGHTDRIGNKQYNQLLSEARAASVAEYFNENAKVKAEYAVNGVGFTQPSGKTEKCSGPISSQLIACLAPDRRVVITIIK
jgi:OOP family OmpA-OmpF porin